MKTSPMETKVSMFSRVLAWIFVACGAFALIGLAVTAVRHEPQPMSREEIAGLVIGLLFICPLFLFVAVKGRSPRWLTSMENLHGDLARRRGVSASGMRSSRRSMAVSATVVFGVSLAYFGSQMGIFSGDTGWFAMVVFGLVWLIVAGIFWRMYRAAGRVRDADSKEPEK
jgi:uncharacterized membrane protein